MSDTGPDFLAILKELASRKVDFIVVGGVGAVLQGAPIATFDLDVVHFRAPENLDRLESALSVLDAFYREHKDKRIPPSHSGLAGPAHHLLMTRAGPLDVLGVLTGGRAYADLLPHVIELEIEAGLSVKVLDLSMLITLKEELGQEKDLAVLPVLRRTLAERNRAGS
jgi:hypothetical protein